MELPQKLKVILEEQAQIVDAITQHRQAFDPHSKSIAAIGFAVDIDGLEHFGVDHSAAHDFQPSGLAAHTAAFAVAHHTFDIDFSGRLGKREIRRPEAHLDIFLKKSA